jgi:RNA polymerase sigma factor (TIGR02999 family)
VDIFLSNSVDDSPTPVTEILGLWKSGNEEALKQLIPWLYEDLRRVARRQLRRERHNHSFQSAALVNEAYLRLGLQKPVDVVSRQHFLLVASRLMRQILVDHARKFGAQKRGADHIVTLDTSVMFADTPSLEMVQIDDALNALAKLDARQVQIVELRFFGGLSNEEVAELLAVSVATVKRDWNVARAWLARELTH